MNLLVDAQLPRRLANGLYEAGHDARHTQDLPGKNYTTDTEIIDIAASECCVVVTKDDALVNSFLLARQPHKFVLISLRISHAELESLFILQVATAASMFEGYDYAEWTPSALVIHV